MNHCFGILHPIAKLNERIFTLETGIQECIEYKLELVEEHFCRKSVYMVLENVPFIVLNKRLRGLEKVEKLAHELNHFHLHVAEPLYEPTEICPLWGCKHERQAEVFALVRMVPRYLLGRFPVGCYDTSTYVGNLIKRRWKIFDDYGF